MSVTDMPSLLQFFRGRWYVGQSFGTLFNDVYKKCIMLDAVLNERTVNLTVYEYIPMLVSYISLHSVKNSMFPWQLKVSSPFCWVAMEECIFFRIFVWYVLVLQRIEEKQNLFSYTDSFVDLKLLNLHNYLYTICFKISSLFKCIFLNQQK